MKGGGRGREWREARQGDGGEKGRLIAGETEEETGRD